MKANARPIILAAIGVWIAVQMIVPASYYVIRDDKHDERFAWRMFSPMRMLSCDPKFTVDGDAVSLGETFHEGWVEIARRGRLVVLEAMARKLCTLHPTSAVILDMTCTTLDGETESWGGSDLCRFPEL